MAKVKLHEKRNRGSQGVREAGTKEKNEGWKEEEKRGVKEKATGGGKRKMYVCEEFVSEHC